MRGKTNIISSSDWSKNEIPNSDIDNYVWRNIPIETTLSVKYIKYFEETNVFIAIATCEVNHYTQFNSSSKIFISFDGGDSWSLAKEYSNRHIETVEYLNGKYVFIGSENTTFLGGAVAFYAIYTVNLLDFFENKIGVRTVETLAAFSFVDDSKLVFVTYEPNGSSYSYRPNIYALKEDMRTVTEEYITAINERFKKCSFFYKNRILMMYSDYYILENNSSETIFYTYDVVLKQMKHQTYSKSPDAEGTSCFIDKGTHICIPQNMGSGTFKIYRTVNGGQYNLLEEKYSVKFASTDSIVGAVRINDEMLYIFHRGGYIGHLDFSIDNILTPLSDVAKPALDINLRVLSTASGNKKIVIGGRDGLLYVTDTDKIDTTLHITPSIVKKEIIIKPNDYVRRVNISAVDRMVDENIKPENIKKGVEILGVVGTLG